MRPDAPRNWRDRVALAAYAQSGEADPQRARHTVDRAVAAAGLAAGLLAILGAIVGFTTAGELLRRANGPVHAAAALMVLVGVPWLLVLLRGVVLAILRRRGGGLIGRLVPAAARTVAARDGDPSNRTPGPGSRQSTRSDVGGTAGALARHFRLRPLLVRVCPGRIRGDLAPDGPGRTWIRVGEFVASARTWPSGGGNLGCAPAAILWRHRTRTGGPSAHHRCRRPHRTGTSSGVGHLSLWRSPALPPAAHGRVDHPRRLARARRCGTLAPTRGHRRQGARREENRPSAPTMTAHTLPDGDSITAVAGLERPAGQLWPPPLAGATTELDIVHDANSLTRATGRLGADSDSRVAIVAWLPATPDRGVERQVSALAEASARGGVLVLDGGDALRSREPSETVAIRHADWSALAKACGVPVVDFDFTNLTDTSQAAWLAFLGGTAISTSTDPAPLDASFAAISAALDADPPLPDERTAGKLAGKISRIHGAAGRSVLQVFTETMRDAGARSGHSGPSDFPARARLSSRPAARRRTLGGNRRDPRSPRLRGRDGGSSCCGSRVARLGDEWGRPGWRTRVAATITAR